MGKFRNHIFALAGLIILAGAFTVIGPYIDLGHSKPPPSVTDVNVVNTASFNCVLRAVGLDRIP